jgi:hypothetical protein
VLKATLLRRKRLQVCKAKPSSISGHIDSQQWFFITWSL